VNEIYGNVTWLTACATINHVIGLTSRSFVGLEHSLPHPKAARPRQTGPILVSPVIPTTTRQ